MCLGPSRRTICGNYEKKFQGPPNIAEFARSYVNFCEREKKKKKTGNPEGTVQF